LSVILNAALAVTKVFAGLAFHSQAIMADGLHTATDLFTDIAVLAGLRASSKPADLDHHYGHRRITTLVGLIIGASLLLASAIIVMEAVKSFHALAIEKNLPPIQAGLPMWLAIVTIPVKEMLFRVTRVVGRRTGDVSLIANAWHHRSDAVTSVGASLGLGAVLIGGEQWRFMDPLAATVLAAWLAGVAVNIIRENAGELIDRAPESHVLDSIEQVVRNTEGVKEVHAFRARRIGGKIAMDINVMVEPGLTVRQGHDIASDVQKKVQESIEDVLEVLVHIEPAY